MKKLADKGGAQIFSKALTVAVFTAVSRFLGFLRELALSYFYGAGRVSDAFVVAFTVPSVVFGFLSSAAAVCYIPLYQENRARKDFFTSNVLNITLLIGFVFSAVFTFFPEAVTFVFASRLDAETFALAARFMRVMVWCAAFVFAADVLRGFLQIKNAFFASTAS